MTDPKMTNNDQNKDWNWQTSACWLVDTPWVGPHAATIGKTKEEALANAELSRAAHVKWLQIALDRWTNYQLKAQFAEAVGEE